MNFKIQFCIDMYVNQCNAYVVVTRNCLFVDIATVPI